MNLMMRISFFQIQSQISFFFCSPQQLLSAFHISAYNLLLEIQTRGKSQLPALRISEIKEEFVNQTSHVKPYGSHLRNCKGSSSWQLKEQNAASRDVIKIQKRSMWNTAGEIPYKHLVKQETVFSKLQSENLTTRNILFKKSGQQKSKGTKCAELA